MVRGGLLRSQTHFYSAPTVRKRDLHGARSAHDLQEAHMLEIGRAMMVPRHEKGFINWDICCGGIFWRPRRDGELWVRHVANPGGPKPVWPR